jgi:hypothetical protein
LQIGVAPTLIAQAKTLAFLAGHELDDVLQAAQTFGPSQLEVRRASHKNDGIWYEVVAQDGLQAIPVLCFRSKQAAGQFHDLLTELVLLAGAEAEGLRPHHFAKVSAALERSAKDRMDRTVLVGSA